MSEERANNSEGLQQNRDSEEEVDSATGSTGSKPPPPPPGGEGKEGGQNKECGTGRSNRVIITELALTAHLLPYTPGILTPLYLRIDITIFFRLSAQIGSDSTSLQTWELSLGEIHQHIPNMFLMTWESFWAPLQPIPRTYFVCPRYVLMFLPMAPRG